MKKAALLLAAILLLMHPAAAACLVTGEAYGVGAAAAIVMEAESGEVLFAQEIHRQLPMASTTKIMTALLTLEQPNLQQEFTVDETAIRVEGSSMGLQEGDVVTKRMLCYGMLLPSGNDAANATAVRLAGSIPEFAKLMNARAARIGMTHTCFVTPSGLGRCLPPSAHKPGRKCPEGRQHAPPDSKDAGSTVPPASDSAIFSSSASRYVLLYKHMGDGL